ncbi:hypothetical protein BT69DRAFT_1295284 [Atractiella rhizophila]|nr:hypothetical protein BT69DRAFT_1295284 [Atractiella rhizophila]
MSGVFPTYTERDYPKNTLPLTKASICINRHVGSTALSSVGTSLRNTTETTAPQPQRSLSRNCLEMQQQPASVGGMRASTPPPGQSQLLWSASPFPLTAGDGPPIHLPSFPHQERAVNITTLSGMEGMGIVDGGGIMRRTSVMEQPRLSSFSGMSETASYQRTRKVYVFLS